MKCELIRELTFAPSAGPEKAGQPAPIGTVIENPKAYKLVLNGDAVPADPECAVACYARLFPREEIPEKFSEPQAAKLKQAVEGLIRKKNPVAAGIWPEDYDAYQAGEMSGYDPETGEPIPGPNAVYDGPIEMP